MYSIGEFSKITSLTVKALRLYHEKEILVPSSVDSETGYRNYSVSDLERARAIVYLKEMRFSLNEIKEILREFSDESEITSFFEKKRNELAAQAAHLASISTSIDAIIQKEHEVAQIAENQEFEIEEKTLEEQIVISSRWKGKYGDSAEVFPKLFKVANRHANGHALNLYYDDEYKETDADVESCIPLQKEINGKDHEVKTLPSGKFVTLIHKGPYEEISRTYQRIVDYLKEKNLPIQTPFREVYLKGPGMIFKGNPKNYLTEIQFLVG